MIQPRRHWLDANGNEGFKGNPMSPEILYMVPRFKN